MLDTYFTRVARISANGTIPLSSLRRIPKLPPPTNWVDCVPTANITVVAPIQCRINNKGKVEMRGTYRHTGNRITFWDIGLPDGFTPSHRRPIVLGTGSSVVFVNAVVFGGRIATRLSDLEPLTQHNNTLFINIEFDL